MERDHDSPTPYPCVFVGCVSVGWSATMITPRPSGRPAVGRS
ncbi:hypothetical protein CU044_6208 [Streptomyces sp. L-9-10]|nr:hypothetical protein CU044_6208 [Streptomyces sp. L-9-10]